MRKRSKVLLSLAVLLVMSIAVVGCGGGTTEPAPEPQEEPSGDNGAAVEQPATADPVGEQVNYEIVGIEPGAGLMMATFDVIEQYELEGWRLVESSSAAMATSLKRAYDNQEPIIVTGWTPHWKFSSFDLKYLDDPKNIYGGDEQIHTLVRNGLAEDHPSAYAVLDNFYWEAADMEDVMVVIEAGTDAKAAAEAWVADNQDKVAAWTEGVEPVDGDSINVAFVAWDSEIASTNVIATVLESVGYEVTQQQLEAGGMFAGISEGGSDAMVAAWLPTTHASYYERFQDGFEDLGPNLDGTRIGLVVPAYMDIDSIEDLR